MYLGKIPEVFSKLRKHFSRWLNYRNTRIKGMSESHRLRCSNCLGRNFLTLLQAVEHVTSERGTQKGNLGSHVQCCVQGCSKRVRKLRPHIRKSHKELCPQSCSACRARFVERKDLDNHQRNGCPRGKQIVGQTDLDNHHSRKEIG